MAAMKQSCFLLRMENTTPASLLRIENTTLKALLPSIVAYLFMDVYQPDNGVPNTATSAIAKL